MKEQLPSHLTIAMTEALIGPSLCHRRKRVKENTEDKKASGALRLPQSLVFHARSYLRGKTKVKTRAENIQDIIKGSQDISKKRITLEKLHRAEL